MVLKPGLTCRQALDGFFEFVDRMSCGETPLLVAHNGAQFDVPVLLNACKLTARALPLDYYHLDSVRLARFISRNNGPGRPANHSLVSHTVPCLHTHQLWKGQVTFADAWPESGH